MFPKIFRGIAFFCGLAVLTALCGMSLVLMQRRHLVDDGGLPLRIKWEGLLARNNFRDLGSSLNQCLGTPFFVEGRVLRANVMFSGWNCAKVGSPQVIYSLNFTPNRHERYYCLADDKIRIGRFFNPAIELHDIERIETWQNPAMREPICLFLADMLQVIGSGSSILIHCDAGRDRTGAVSALLAALAAENADAFDNRMIDAIECDYTKSKSLAADRYGSMRHFLQEIAARGGVTAFLAAQCSLDRSLMQKNIASWRVPK